MFTKESLINLSEKLIQETQKHLPSMPYITRKPVEVLKLVCDHPRVKSFWEWGGASINPTGDFVYSLSMILDNDERIDFRDKNPDDAIEKAEKYLNELK